MVKKYFSDTDNATLANICRVAAERFSEHARALIDPGTAYTEVEGSLIASPAVAKRLAEQFERQAEEALSFASIFDEGEPFVIEYDPA